MAHGLRVKALYKQLLHHAQLFPSIKREAIIQDIKLEFREQAALKDAAKIAAAVDAATRGLATMQKYTGLDKRSSHWRVNLEDDPLGQKEAEQRRAERLYAERKAAKAARDASTSPASRSSSTALT